MESPFPFLLLPKELRLMVYEELLPTRVRKRIRIYKSKGPKEKEKIYLIRCTVPVSILRSCRLIHTEALPFIQHHMQDAKQHRPTIISHSLKSHDGPINALATEMKYLIRGLGYSCSPCYGPPVAWVHSRCKYDHSHASALDRDQFKGYVMWMPKTDSEIAKLRGRKWDDVLDFVWYAGLFARVWDLGYEHVKLDVEER